MTPTSKLRKELRKRRPNRKSDYEIGWEDDKSDEAKVIKAWAIVLDGELAHYKQDGEYRFAATKRQAMQGLDPKLGYKVVRLQITYKLKK